MLARICGGMFGCAAKDFECEVDVVALIAGRQIRLKLARLLIRLPNGAKDIWRFDDARAIVGCGEWAMGGDCAIRLLQVDDRRVTAERSQPCVEITVGIIGEEIRPLLDVGVRASKVSGSGMSEGSGPKPE